MAEKQLHPSVLCDITSQREPETLDRQNRLPAASFQSIFMVLYHHDPAASYRYQVVEENTPAPRTYGTGVFHFGIILFTILSFRLF